ncbi:carbohydrate-binding protein [Vibrio marisflavi]|uniref:Chitin-binding type-3 domain-containing protein n=1 Tax=Vibrio marisflavi CECT 7928 TaxID=634439 RepID=A0ABN8E9B0_9VIBR|nr:hypothetical protein [Vibrio marisflavi]CAH0541475.1 hypothetical protein VMF7928_03583 [Vibrio marisflavi CECT 7928]
MEISNSIVIGMILAPLAFSNVHALEIWDAQKIYTSGNLVKWKDKAYISSHQTIGIMPITNNISWDGWVDLETDTVEAWEQGSTYNSGDIVEFNTVYYIAKWQSQGTLPEGNSSWQRLGIDSTTMSRTFKQELTPEVESVVGFDKNRDGLRDDYAEIITNYYSKQEEIRLAILAGTEFGKYIEFSENDIDISIEDAKYMAINIGTLRHCLDLYKTLNPNFIDPAKLYFNTLDRALAKRKASSRLYKSLQGNEPEVLGINCEPFIQGVRK